MVREITKPSKFEELRSVGSASELLIFVHGLGGHYRKTWGQLPDFMEDDQRFDETDFYLLGYDSGLLKFFVPGIHTLAQRLITILLHEYTSQDTVRIISHSMGGLIVKEAISQALLDGKAQELSRLRHVIFCSTPHLGETKANILQFIGRHLKELKALKPTTMASHKIWISRVTQTSSRLEDDISHERYALAVRITNFWGLSDKMVTEVNATALPTDENLIVPGDHSSIVKPRNTDDQVYLDLSSVLNSSVTSRNPRPSERIMARSRSLGDSNLVIRRTLELPERYEQLCSAYQLSKRGG